MLKYLFQCIFLSFFLFGCSANIIAINPAPTIVITNTPTLTPTKEATPTPKATPTIAPSFTPPSIAISDLPQGWKMDSYQQKHDGEYAFAAIYRKYSIAHNWGEFHHTGWGYGWNEFVKINNQTLQVKAVSGTNQPRSIDITLNNTPYMSIECDNKNSTFWDNLIAFWGYDNHWVVEYICNGQQGIVLDGQYLNTIYGYSSSFASYLVSEKLFFFFKRDNSLGFYYDGIEYPLSFDDVSYHFCCEASAVNPEFYNDKLTFVGIQDDVRYYAIMGNLDNK